MTTADETTHLRALLADATARAEKAEVERDAITWERNAVEDRLAQALAACAEMRAALEAQDEYSRGAPAIVSNDAEYWRRVKTQEQRRATATRMREAALSRTDLGRGWASPEDTAQMVGALQMVESDGEFDSLHEVTRKFVVDVLALLKEGGG